MIQNRLASVVLLRHHVMTATTIYRYHLASANNQNVPRHKRCVMTSTLTYQQTITYIVLVHVAILYGIISHQNKDFGEISRRHFSPNFCSVVSTSVRRYTDILLFVYVLYVQIAI